ncbi:TetR/AcrR family transcriptional regulator [Herbaspirillum lusitanum]|uniref:TetR/AcrR family transcriptional regulator n=1 Tax=Herbaspirillum lusitanum TaxID=213312 RepID=UPI0002DF9213|nr:TetR/AcrR family transcriptional regulator [Herbaspirillum lusitanum]MCW5298600.1 TetR/AcrR family transcriptional regulator [Herbaspirillum lusitanum]
MSAIDTREKIMAAARKTVQAHGYNALSFRDLAAEVGIKSASVHYHFPTKGDLGAALARRYTEDGIAYLGNLMEVHKDARTRIKKYAEIFRAALADDNRMCLCGIMSAEHNDLPPEVRAEVNRFNDVNVDWLTEVLMQGTAETKPKKALRRQAMSIFAAIGGAQLMARGHGDIAVYDEIVDSYRNAGFIP